MDWKLCCAWHLTSLCVTPQYSRHYQKFPLTSSPHNPENELECIAQKWIGHWNDTEVWNCLSDADVFPSRSTLCSVMAQLTEDIQPCFETTLKSKAVSENCNVKFTCVVSGRSAPNGLVHLQASAYCFLIVCDLRRQGVTNLKTKEGFTLKAPWWTALFILDYFIKTH